MNKQLVRMVVNQIEADLAKWDQESWAAVEEDKEDKFRAEASVHEDDDGARYYAVNKPMCGTSFCFAGHAVLVAGEAILFDPDDLSYVDLCLTRDGKIKNISERAEELLGLDAAQGNRLFDGEAGHGNFQAYKHLVTEVTGVEFE